MQKVPEAVIVEADFFISYLRGDELADRVEKLLKLAIEKRVSLLVSSEIYDDIITAYRSQGYSVHEVQSLLSDLRAIPHEAVPFTVETAILAMNMYAKHGGSRKLHYFDSFHVAASLLMGIPLVTSDEYILERSAELGIKTMALRQI